jgi:hypothetical protein
MSEVYYKSALPVCSARYSFYTDPQHGLTPLYETALVYDARQSI